MAFELVGMNLWIFLLLLAAGITWALAAVLRPSRAKRKTMLFMGLFLAVGDFVFETAGYVLQYWTAQNSVFQLGPAVPIEVFGIALFAGATMNLLFPRAFEWRFAAPAAFLIASAGTGIEALLVQAGNLVYQSGWTSYHAFAWYFIAFLVFQAANAWISQTYAPRETPKAKRR